MKNETTGYRGYPKPHIDNYLQEDVGRVRQSLDMIDADVADILQEHDHLQVAQLAAQQQLQGQIDDQRQSLEAELEHLRQIVVGSFDIEGPPNPIQGQSRLSYKIDTEGAESYDWSATGFIIQGRDDSISLAQSDELDQAATAYTIMVWVKPEPSVGAMDITGKEGFNHKLTIRDNGSVSHVFQAGDPPAEVTITTDPGTVKYREWNHLIVWNDGQTARIYVNGIKVIEATTDQPIPSVSQLIIGRNPLGTADNFYRGRISHLRLYNKGLHEGDLLSLMNADSNSHAQTASESGLLLYLPLDELPEGKVIDHSGLSRPSTVTGNPQIITDDLMGKVMTFNGTSDSIVFERSSDIDAAAGSYTLMVWVKDDSDSSGLKSVIGTAGNNFCLDLDPELDTAGTNGYFRHGFREVGNSTSSISTSSKSFKKGEWHHVALWRDAGLARIYIDGRLKAETVAGDPEIFPSELEIGQNPKSTGSSNKQWYKGALAHIRMYNRALPVEEIRRLMYPELFRHTRPFVHHNLLLNLPLDRIEGGTVIDSSSFKRPVTVSGVPAIATDPELGEVLEFNGTDTMLELPQSTDLDQAALAYTVQFWIWPDPNPNTGWFDIMCKTENNYSFFGKLNGECSHGFRSGGVYNGGRIPLPAGTLPMRTWTHVTLWNNGLIARTYLNGKKWGEITGKTPEMTISPLKIGKFPGSSNSFFRGKMSRVRIYNAALPESEIARNIYLDQYEPILSDRLLLHFPMAKIKNGELVDASKYQHTSEIQGIPKIVEDETMGPVLEMNYDPTPGFVEVSVPSGIESATLMVNINLGGNVNLQKSRTFPVSPPRPPKAETILYSGEIVSWFVPDHVYAITLEVCGAQGGHGSLNYIPTLAGGKGARMRGTFKVVPGDELLILVGGQGGGLSRLNYYGPGAGGGGTFVVRVDPEGLFQMQMGDEQKILPMIIAGGGGGGGTNQNGQTFPGGPGQISEDGQGFDGQAGGRNGGGGAASIYNGGGAGFQGDGAASHASVAKSFLNGGIGGTGTSSAKESGGFGGGGGSSLWPGAGGGYSGGLACGTYSSSGFAGGGGSYNAGEEQNNEAGVWEGFGQVTIFY